MNLCNWCVEHHRNKHGLCAVKFWGLAISMAVTIMATTVREEGHGIRIVGVTTVTGRLVIILILILLIRIVKDWMLRTY